MRHNTVDQRVPTPTQPGCGPPPLVRRPQGHDERSTNDYTGSVLFNAYARELWRRFTIALRRTLARRAGLTSKTFAAQARLSYAKVAEYQRRGVVHLHAIVRPYPAHS